MRFNPRVPTDLSLVAAAALFIAGLALVAFAAVPSHQGAALAEPQRDHDRRDNDRRDRDHDRKDHDKRCDSNERNFNDKKCKTPTPTATVETPTATPVTPTATPEDPTATPEDPTATPTPEEEEPTATPTATPEDTEEPTATPTPDEEVSGEEPTATPELIIEVIDEAEEVIVLSAAPSDEVAVLPATGSGGSTSGFDFRLAAGIATMALGALIGLYGRSLGSSRE